MASSLLRYILFWKCVQDIKFEFINDFEVIFLFNVIKYYYMVDVKYQTTSFEDKFLTVGSLLVTFSNISNTEVYISNFNINIQKIGNIFLFSKILNKKDSDKDKDKKIDYIKYDKKVYNWQKYMLCGYYVTIKADIYWFCNSEQALDSQRFKKDIITKKAAAITTSISTLGNNTSTNFTTLAIIAPNFILLYTSGMFMAFSSMNFYQSPQQI